ncbi:hypothetical protein DXG01_000288 [Tephrocybe rancida]|nr:hypothetical protein DXG01_000288 [Tephrocybe rancida]
MGATEQEQCTSSSPPFVVEDTNLIRVPQVGIIFDEVAKLAEKANREGPWNHREKFRRVRNVSHVCSHWRNVALYTPKLWSDIPLDYPECVEEMLERSKMALLTIAYRPPSRSFTSPTKPSNSLIALKEMLSFHLPRNRNLNLGTLPQAIYGYAAQDIKITDVLALLDQPAPTTEHLELRFAYAEGLEQNKLPDAISRGLSRLESLILERYAIGSFDLREPQIISLVPYSVDDTTFGYSFANTSPRETLT